MKYRPHRYNTTYPVEVVTPLGSQQAVVLDIHNEGAQLEGLRGMHRSDRLQLRILSLRVDAVVMWATGYRTGILFRPRITNDQVDTLRYRRDARKAARRGSVGFGFVEMR
ncbi:PilZ domain-containing protein [Yoonia sediminilitoris]|uniref:PilZ domain-containing protein n=1 Tax=Yoonia sediminilitoris TaxID=1286148 RepID=A0A2T6KEQ6_9RHOB|nr:PilZ domain-containing protein [Yoonia sediminilitoris]PUB13577.1 hypothetical protein C8N45_10736 [Yoonia sediminilitoris]RCW94747.1 hypothetical protein DFP92_10736 [Yoonia sediminilitoris]